MRCNLFVDHQLRLRCFALHEEYGRQSVLHAVDALGADPSRLNPGRYIRSNLECFISLLETLRHVPHVKLMYALHV